jgi:hypothetical protein
MIPYPKRANTKRVRGTVQVVEGMPSKHKALSSKNQYFPPHKKNVSEEIAR